MSKPIYDSSNGRHSLVLTEYSGGAEQGLCIQLTGYNCDGKIGYVGMTRKEAGFIAHELLRWVEDAF